MAVDFLIQKKGTKHFVLVMDLSFLFLAKHYTEKQNIRGVAQVVRASQACLTKRLMFEDGKYTIDSRHHKTLYETVIESPEDQGVSAEV